MNLMNPLVGPQRSLLATSSAGVMNDNSASSNPTIGNLSSSRIQIPSEVIQGSLITRDMGGIGSRTLSPMKPQMPQHTVPRLQSYATNPRTQLNRGISSSSSSSSSSDSSLSSIQDNDQ